MVNPLLLGKLACPSCAGDGACDAPLRYSRLRGLTCGQCGGSYRVYEEGIPDMVPCRADSPESFYIESESRQWDGQADKYDEKRSIDPLYMAGIEAVLRWLRPERHHLVLDAACGTGLTIEKYVHRCSATIGLDLSLKSLIHARTKLNSRSVGLVKGELTTLPFVSNTFDRVLCANAIQHIPTIRLRASAIKELARVSKPGATVVVSCHNFSLIKKRSGWSKEKRGAGSHSGPVQYIYRFDKEELLDLLSPFMKVHYIRGAGFPFPYGLKLSPLSAHLERLCHRFSSAVPWANMLIGVCTKSQ